MNSATSVDLADPAVRRVLLPLWMESGPAGAFANHVTFPQLVAEWPHLRLTALLRTAWEECFPQLARDWSPPEDDSPPWAM